MAEATQNVQTAPDQGVDVDDRPVQSDRMIQLKRHLGDMDMSEQQAALSPSMGGGGIRDLLSTPSSVQKKGGGKNRDVHQAAAHGISDSGGSLPHLGAIQNSFGGHDVSSVKSHVGGPAEQANKAIGSSAYATGNDVAFKAAPDLHTAAHEAAHVVQQRSGVSLAGGVGQVGDKYEKHADSVADKVVQGASAAPLLGSVPGASSKSDESVQMEKATRPPGAVGAVQQLIQPELDAYKTKAEELANVAVLPAPDFVAAVEACQEKKRAVEAAFENAGQDVPVQVKIALGKDGESATTALDKVKVRDFASASAEDFAALVAVGANFTGSKGRIFVGRAERLAAGFDAYQILAEIKTITAVDDLAPVTALLDQLSTKKSAAGGSLRVDMSSHESKCLNPLKAAIKASFAKQLEPIAESNAQNANNLLGDPALVETLVARRVELKAFCDKVRQICVYRMRDGLSDGFKRLERAETVVGMIPEVEAALALIPINLRLGEAGQTEEDAAKKAEEELVLKQQAVGLAQSITNKFNSVINEAEKILTKKGGLTRSERVHLVKTKIANGIKAIGMFSKAGLANRAAKKLTNKIIAWLESKKYIENKPKKEKKKVKGAGALLRAIGLAAKLLIPIPVIGHVGTAIASLGRFVFELGQGENWMVAGALAAVEALTLSIPGFGELAAIEALGGLLTTAEAAGEVLDASATATGAAATAAAGMAAIEGLTDPEKTAKAELEKLVERFKKQKFHPPSSIVGPLASLVAKEMGG